MTRTGIHAALIAAAITTSACGPNESKRLEQQRIAQAQAAHERQQAQLRELGTETPGVRRVSSNNQAPALQGGWTNAALQHRRAADAQLNQAVNLIAGSNSDLAAQGRALFQSHSCMVCHATSPNIRSTGPNFSAGIPAGAWGAVRALDGQRPVVLNLDYLNESLMQPRRRTAQGYGDDMPSYAGILEPRDVVAIAVYLRSIATPTPTDTQLAQTPTHSINQTSRPTQQSPSNTNQTNATPQPAQSAASQTNRSTDNQAADRPLTPAMADPANNESTSPSPAPRQTDEPAPRKPEPTPQQPNQPAQSEPPPTFEPTDPTPTIDPRESADAQALTSNRPAWYFEGLRVEASVATACAEVISDSIAQTRTLAVSTARERIAQLLNLNSPAELKSDRLELVSVIPVPTGDGSVRYAGYVLISAER